ncbi:DUF501 domain-containing protein [soil metagenome]
MAADLGLPLRRRQFGVNEVVAVQIGRPLRADSQVMTKCHLGLPVVVQVPPILDDGTPFPTTFWLTCPLAVKRVSRLESAGEIKRFEERRRHDSAFESALIEAHRRYALERDRLVPANTDHRASGGVGGAAVGIKCLHAHYADHAAGNQNPVGVEVASEIEPLDCEVSCVIAGARNPDWREPS